MEETNRTYTQPALFPDGKDTVAVFPSQIKETWARMAELEALAREIVRVHRDVGSGADIPAHIYKMARDALGETV